MFARRADLATHFDIGIELLRESVEEGTPHSLARKLRKTLANSSLLDPAAEVPHSDAILRLD
jgi:hypothetical protein